MTNKFAPSILSTLKERQQNLDSQQCSISSAQHKIKKSLSIEEKQKNWTKYCQ